MALISARQIHWGLGGVPLIEAASFQIEKGDRVCLLGRNGTGKSTLLKIIHGALVQDSGDLWRQPMLKTAALHQDLPAGNGQTVFEVVAQGAGRAGADLVQFRRLSAASHDGRQQETRQRRDQLQAQLDAAGGWEIQPHVEALLSHANLNPDTELDTLSAGMKRRALFCRTMAGKPDLFLLDEPTNHVDIDTITWMETVILRTMRTLLFVSHDRAFADRIATRVWQLDRGRLSVYDCGYRAHVKRREADLAESANQRRQFEKKLSREEAWIRQGIKARRTRNEGRVRKLKQMRKAYRERRRNIGNVALQLQDAERSGKLVIRADRISYSDNGVIYVRDFSVDIMRGDKIGLIGPNGCGKTTLLKLLTGELDVQNGSVRHGAKLQVAYFDQLRHQLQMSKSVMDNIGQGNDFIVFNGQRRHVISYLKDFLFAPERCHTPVHILSGGEKNRLLLAKLFTRPANVLILDEPTNDLDVETLELLEELLLDYSGTLLLVSHDRAFLNNTVTSTLVFEGNGHIQAYPGGYDDWLDQRPEQKPAPGKAANPRKPSPASPKRNRSRKLGYMEQRELASLPDTIDALEKQRDALLGEMSQPDFYKGDKTDITTTQARLDTLEQQITALYTRWEQLESKRADDIDPR